MYVVDCREITVELSEMPDVLRSVKQIVLEWHTSGVANVFIMDRNGFAQATPRPTD